MRITNLRQSSALTSVAFAAMLATSSPVLAQTAPTAPPEDTLPKDQGTVDKADGDGAIVVTGSRIRSPNLTSVVPVTSISGEDFFKTG